MTSVIDHLQVVESIFLDGTFLPDDLVAIVDVFDGGVGGSGRSGGDWLQVAGRSLEVSIELVLVPLPVPAVWAVSSIIWVWDVDILSLVLWSGVPEKIKRFF